MAGACKHDNEFSRTVRGELLAYQLARTGSTKYCRLTTHKIIRFWAFAKQNEGGYIPRCF
jgi:hypothetical protein